MLNQWILISDHMEQEIKQIKLVDAQKMKSKYPETFWTPSDSELSDIKIGDIVKVCDDHERFWVIIESISNKEFIGVVDNSLLRDDIRCGDYIKFERRHIYDIN